MQRNGVRSLALLSVMIAFAFLLLCGGSRLIGHADELRPYQQELRVVLDAAFSQAPQKAEETMLAERNDLRLQRGVAIKADREYRIPAFVICDANGNVLRCGSYLREVYQAFSLGDGFV